MAYKIVVDAGHGGCEMRKVLQEDAKLSITEQTGNSGKKGDISFPGLNGKRRLPQPGKIHFGSISGQEIFFGRSRRMWPKGCWNKA